MTYVEPLAHENATKNKDRQWSLCGHIYYKKIETPNLQACLFVGAHTDTGLSTVSLEAFVPST